MDINPSLRRGWSYDAVLILFICPSIIGNHEPIDYYKLAIQPRFLDVSFAVP